MVRMRMMPADHFEALLACRLFRSANVLRGHREAVARRIVSPIDERKELQDLPRGRALALSPIAFKDSARIASEQRAAAFMRITLRSMRADLLREISADPECRCIRHDYSSSQNRSFKYFAAESATTVTITAFALFGIPAATWKQPSNAAAELGLTSKPSSRARRFTSL